MQLHYDADYTGPQDQYGYWILTNEQWWLIAKILFREILRTNASGQLINQTTIEMAHREAGSLLYCMKTEAFGAWSWVVAGTRIDWRRYACVAAMWSRQSVAKRESLRLDMCKSILESPTQEWAKWFSENPCPAEVYYDDAYQSGLFVYGATTNPYAPDYCPYGRGSWNLACTPEWQLQERVDNIWMDAGFSENHSYGGYVKSTMSPAQDAGLDVNISFGGPLQPQPPEDDNSAVKWFAIVAASALAITLGGLAVHHLTKGSRPTP